MSDKAEIILLYDDKCAERGPVFNPSGWTEHDRIRELNQLISDHPDYIGCRTGQLKQIEDHSTCLWTGTLDLCTDEIFDCVCRTRWAHPNGVMLLIRRPWADNYDYYCGVEQIKKELESLREAEAE